jgi:hypothetical protein
MVILFAQYVAWKAADWAGPGADQHLLKWLEQELNQAITHDDNFSFKGLPFDKVRGRTAKLQCLWRLTRVQRLPT